MLDIKTTYTLKAKAPRLNVNPGIYQSRTVKKVKHNTLSHMQQKNGGNTTPYKKGSSRLNNFRGTLLGTCSHFCRVETSMFLFVLLHEDKQENM